MISEERLEELIKNSQPVYYGLYEVIYPHKWKGYTINSRYLFRSTFNAPQWFYNLNDLFETKEEAEWYFKFGNIQRTETLRLPSCEEIEKRFKNNHKFGGHLIVEFDDIQLMIFIDNYSKKFIELTNQHRKPLTKENYIKACETCRKFFLGEEVEE